MGKLSVTQPVYPSISRQWKSAVMAAYVGNDIREVISGAMPVADSSVRRIDNSNITRAYTVANATTNYDSTVVRTAESYLVILTVDQLADYNFVFGCQDSPAGQGYEFRLANTDSPINNGLIVVKGSPTGLWQYTPNVSSLVFPGDTNLAIFINIYSDILIPPEFFIKGIKYTGQAYALPSGSGNYGTQTDALRIGNRIDGFTYFHGSVSLLVPFNRTLSDAEAFSLLQNPWQIFTQSYTYTLKNIASTITGKDFVTLNFNLGSNEATAFYNNPIVTSTTLAEAFIVADDSTGDHTNIDEQYINDLIGLTCSATPGSGINIKATSTQKLSGTIKVRVVWYTP